MKNYALYDDTYLGPGILIVSKENDNIVKFLKIFTMSDNGFPNYGLRAFSILEKDKIDKEFTTIDFTFTSTDTDENDLYEIFKNLCISLNDQKVETIDKFSQGKNHFSLKEDNHKVILTIFKDIYGVKDITNFTNINIGDDITCDNYQAIAKFYNNLLNSNIKEANNNDIKKLVLIH